MEVTTMSSSTRNKIGGFLKEVGGWIFFLICAFYAFYAFYMGIIEILFQLGLVADARPRAVPFMFIIHALSGGVALISGPLQFNRRILSKKLKLHRVVGRIYVVAILISSIGGLWSAIFFNVDIAARIVFGVL